MAMDTKEPSFHTNVAEKVKSACPSVDLTEVPPIHQKRIVAFINHFIISMVEFLNNFAHTCSHKLLAFDQKISKIEAELFLIESKINSVPGLREESIVAPLLSPDVPDHEPAPPTLPEVVPERDVVEQSDVKDDGGELPSSPDKVPDNPELQKFKKMLQFGVPPPAVRLKMEQEGLDPSLLDL